LQGGYHARDDVVRAIREGGLSFLGEAYQRTFKIPSFDVAAFDEMKRLERRDDLDTDQSDRLEELKTKHRDNVNAIRQAAVDAPTRADQIDQIYSQPSNRHYQVSSHGPAGLTGNQFAGAMQVRARPTAPDRPGCLPKAHYTPKAHFLAHCSCSYAPSAPSSPAPRPVPHAHSQGGVHHHHHLADNMKFFYAPDGRLVVCLNAATQTAAMTRGYRPVECTMVSGLSQLNDLDAERARAAAAAAGGGTRRPPPTRGDAAPSRPAAAVPPMPCPAEAAASASAPRAQPAGLHRQPSAAGGDATTEQPLQIPDTEFVVDRAQLLGDPGKAGSSQFLAFQSKLRTCVEDVVCIDNTTKYAPILSWKGAKGYKSKPFRTEALQIHTFLCICSQIPGHDVFAGEQIYTWSGLRDRARAYGTQNRIGDWAATLRACIHERRSGDGAQDAPASEQPHAAAYGAA
jgi:hypothetical protein